MTTNKKAPHKQARKTMLLGLTYNSFFIFIAIDLISLSGLIIHFSGKTVLFVLLLDVIAYLFVQSLDRSYRLEDAHPTRLTESFKSVETRNRSISEKSRPSKI